jgi:hypothetical protein
MIVLQMIRENSIKMTGLVGTYSSRHRMEQESNTKNKTKQNKQNKHTHKHTLISPHVHEHDRENLQYAHVDGEYVVLHHSYWDYHCCY